MLLEFSATIKLHKWGYKYSFTMYPYLLNQLLFLALPVRIKLQKGKNKVFWHIVGTQSIHVE